MEKVNVKNISGCNVGLIVEDMRFHREIAPGKMISVDKEKLEEMLTYPGVEGLFLDKYLTVENPEDAVELGTVESDDIEEVNGKTVVLHCEDAEEIKKVVEEGTDFALKKLLMNQSEARQEEIATIAAKSDKLTYSKIDVIRSITGIDLSKILRN